MKCIEYNQYNVLCAACDFPKSIKCGISGIPYMAWCERTGYEVTAQSYQEFLDKEDIAHNVV